MARGAVETVPDFNVFTAAEDAEMNSVNTVEVLNSYEILRMLVKTDAAKKNIEHNEKDRPEVKIATNSALLLNLLNTNDQRIQMLKL
jgi:hypothetical protein